MNIRTKPRMGPGPPSLTCRQLRLSGPELALGIASPKTGLAARAHMRRCPRCRQQLAELSCVADGLVGLLPPAEPPSEFAERVIAGMGTATFSCADSSDRSGTCPQRRCSSGGLT